MSTTPTPSANDNAAPAVDRAAPLAIGDYVLASKYHDGCTQDHWFVGFFAGMLCNGRFQVHDSNGQPQRGNGFRRCERITAERGAFLLSHAAELERTPGLSIWTYAVEPKGSVMTAPTTRTEGAADGLRECVRAAIRDKHYNERIGFDSAHLADAAIAAVRAYDAAHSTQTSAAACACGGDGG
jgi:hypothetical protein